MEIKKKNLVIRKICQICTRYGVTSLNSFFGSAQRIGRSNGHLFGVSLHLYQCVGGREQVAKVKVAVNGRDHAQNMIICYYDVESETLEKLVSLVWLKVRQQFEGSSFLQWFLGLQISHS